MAAKEVAALLVFAEMGNIGTRDKRCRGTIFPRSDISKIVDNEIAPIIHGLLQLRLCSPVRRNRAGLVHVAEIERIKEIVADGENAAALGRRRQPDRIVARLGDLRHFYDHVGPGDIEQLEHGLGARAGGTGQPKPHQRCAKN